MSKEVTFQDLARYSEKFNRNPQNQVIARAAQRVGLTEAAFNLQTKAQLTHVFNIELETDNVTNQLHSGRCWEFSALNLLRHQFGKKYQVKNFTLSQAYNFFWDKIERANLFYDAMIRLADKPLDDREVRAYLDMASGDGGQWDMAVALILKYGVVPSYAMPENFNTNNTAALREVLGDKEFKDALALRKLAKTGDEELLAKTKDQFLSEIYQITAMAVGEPPKTFDLEFKDDKQGYHLDKNLTPLTFYQKYFDETDLTDYITLTNAPDHEYNKLYTLTAEDNVASSRHVTFLNVPMEFLTQAALAQLKDGEPVWFACDVVRQKDNQTGFLSTELFKYDDLLGVNTQMSKKERLATGASTVAHAMTLVGVDEDRGNVRQWKVENSWGNDRGVKGYYTMSQEWFEEYTYEVVVKTKYLTSDQQKLLTSQPTDLPLWDSLQ